MADINNQRDEFNSTYKQNLMNLENFVMVKFADDDMVVPKESAWFGILDENNTVIDLNDQLIYKEDRLGLKSLESALKLRFVTWPGKHLEVGIGKLVELLDTTLRKRSHRMKALRTFNVQRQ